MVRIDGRTLTLAEVGRVATDGDTRVDFADDARHRVVASRAFIDELLAENERIYGVTTGFGRLSEAFISTKRRLELQLNLIRSHCAGIGNPLSRAEVRAMMLLRANTLACGVSGCRPVVVERLIDLLNHGIHPVVPEVGSVGASGDLSPLAHIALVLIGEGDAEIAGKTIPGAKALKRAGLEPLQLVEKEGLALINGTQGTTALGVLGLLAAENALETLELAGAMSLEALRGTPEPFRQEVHAARPHAGQITTAERLLALLEHSEIRESHRYHDPRVHDAYSLRCMPQVHGAARHALAYTRGILETEVNSGTDNPLVFPDSRLIVSAGNFHAQIVAQALDLLTIALCDVASISQLRIEHLLNPDLSGLPAFLARDPGLHSGLMIAQVAAVDLLSEMRVLSHPASVDSVPTGADKEDHVAMGMAAARKARRAIECFEYILAVELMCAAQALEYRRPLRPGRGVDAGYERVREVVRPLDGDRVLAPDLEALRDLVRSGVFAELVTAFATAASQSAPA